MRLDDVEIDTHETSIVKLAAPLLVLRYTRPLLGGPLVVHGVGSVHAQARRISDAASSSSSQRSGFPGQATA